MVKKIFEILELSFTNVTKYRKTSAMTDVVLAIRKENIYKAAEQSLGEILMNYSADTY